MTVNDLLKQFRIYVSKHKQGEDIIDKAIPIVESIIKDNVVTFDTENMSNDSISLLRECLKKIKCESIILDAPLAEGIYTNKINEIELKESHNEFCLLEDKNMIYGFVRLRGEDAITNTK